MHRESAFGYDWYGPPLLTVITPTRNRPFAFSLLEKWMKRQTRQPDNWLVVNDGDQPYNYTMSQEVIERHPGQDALPSLNENWLAALPFLKGNVVVWEDDEWYHPCYLERMEKELEAAEIVGVGYGVYWNVRTRTYEDKHNFLHAALSATAFRSSLLPMVEEAVKDTSYLPYKTNPKNTCIDLKLWQRAWDSDCSQNTILNQHEGRPLTVGMKGMPGMAGLGAGHRGGGTPDSKGRHLRALIGDDADVYLEIGEALHAYA